MNKIKKIRKNIEIKLKSLTPKENQGMVVIDILRTHYKDLLSFIDSLECDDESIGTDLEEAAENFYKDIECYPSTLQQYNKHIENAFKAGASWQKEQILKKSFEVELASPQKEAMVHLCGCFACGNSGDKAKIVIIKDS
jgi:hypothetical protein